MKQLLIYFISGFLIWSCGPKSKNQLVIKAHIHGLKKGNIYLEKFDGKKMTVIDSIFINDGTEKITFSKKEIEPQLLTLSLDKLHNKKIPFFAENNTIYIETFLDNFIAKAHVSGSTLNAILQKHDAYVKKINNENLDLIKEKLEALKQNNSKKAAEIEAKRLQNLKRLYLFSTNYAIANKNTPVAPFIACYRMEFASLQLKHKIYEALPPEIKNSIYGKQLKSILN